MSKQSKETRTALDLVHAGLAKALEDIQDLRDEVRERLRRLEDVVMETLPAAARDKFMQGILDDGESRITRREDEVEGEKKG